MLWWRGALLLGWYCEFWFWLFWFWLLLLLLLWLKFEFEFEFELELELRSREYGSAAGRAGEGKVGSARCSLQKARRGKCTFREGPEGRVTWQDGRELDRHALALPVARKGGKVRRGSVSRSSWERERCKDKAHLVSNQALTREASLGEANSTNATLFENRVARRVSREVA